MTTTSMHSGHPES
uniref:Uncharacterized protein n=1 Tax=Anguilla anguilla TaxID=7936 RepID=A0A0E9TEU3_ANGAN